MQPTTEDVPIPLAERGPRLPVPRGPISLALIDVLVGRAPSEELPREPVAEPYGDDLQLALYTAYELHYRGFAGVDATLEWEPELLRLRRDLETTFLAALRADVEHSDDVDAELDALLAAPGADDGLASRLATEGAAWQVREYVTQRSLYHLKEADPQAWVIPRLEGTAKATLVAVEHDEYGAGRGDAMHSRLFADMMTDLGLDATYGAYLDVAPATALATVNVMSLFGLHRRWRGALVGQFAHVEITSPPGSARLVEAARRLELGEGMRRFYDEHVEADAMHEQLVRHGLVADLLDREPELAADVVFGLRVSALLDDRLAAQLSGAWDAGVSSLREPPAA